LTDQWNTERGPKTGEQKPQGKKAKKEGGAEVLPTVFKKKGAKKGGKESAKEIIRS